MEKWTLPLIPPPKENQCDSFGIWLYTSFSYAVRHTLTLIFFFFFFLAMPRGLRDRAFSPTRDWTWGPWQWEHWVLTTGPPGNSLNLDFWRQVRTHVVCKQVRLCMNRRFKNQNNFVLGWWDYGWFSIHSKLSLMLLLYLFSGKKL